MKKVTILPMAALVLAACSESPMAPAFEGAPSFHADHTVLPKVTSLGSGVSVAAVGSDVTISWNWSDDEAWDLVSFTLKRNGVTVPVSIANAKPYAANTLLSRSATDEGVADGSYVYCVEAMGKFFSEAHEATMTNHSSECVTVVVGSATYTINILGGSAANGQINTNANNFNFSYELMLNGAVILDCAIVPTVATNPASAIQQHTCDATTGARNILFVNPAKGTSTSFTTTWSMNSATIHTVNFAS